MVITLACDPFYNTIRFHLREIERLDASGYGVYGFWYRNRCIYVGKADEQPIKTRLFQHYQGAHNHSLQLWIDAKGPSLIIAFKYMPITRVRMMEKFCIRRYQPLANKVRHRQETVEVPAECMLR